jgi:hypothetical protein
MAKHIIIASSYIEARDESRALVRDGVAWRDILAFTPRSGMIHLRGYTLTADDKVTWHSRHRMTPEFIKAAEETIAMVTR